MTLSQAETGKTYVVINTELDRTLEARLEVLGLTSGGVTRVLNKKRNGAMIIMVRGTRLAVGNKIINGIHIQETEEVIK